MLPLFDQTHLQQHLTRTQFLVLRALLIHGMNQQRLEVTKLTLKLADSNWEIFNSYPNSATPY